MQRLSLLGLNHTTAPLEVREKLAFNAAQRREAVAEFRRRFDTSEVVLLSTCNRVELYTTKPSHGGFADAGSEIATGASDAPGASGALGASDAPGANGTWRAGDASGAASWAEELARFLAEVRGVPVAAFRPHLYHKVDTSVVEHLFAVASSMDSMVLGETQILGQVREAYDAARELKAAGPVLHPLFQRAVAVGKQVMAETALSEGRVSVASVAVEYARRIFDHFADKTVLSIGAGKMAALVLQHFAALRPGRLMVCNRDPVKAQSLAARFGGEAAPFDAMAEHLVAADIVVSGTGAPLPIITRKLFDAVLKQRRYRPVFLIDIALPRDVEPAVGQLDHVYLYNLDDLQQAVSATRSQRREALDAAGKIVAEHVRQFTLAHRARELGPAIDRLYRRYHALAQEELARTVARLPNVSAEERSHLEEFARRMVNKLLHDPVRTLRNSDALHGNAAQYLHALEMLFHLRDRHDPGDDPGDDPDSHEEKAGDR